MTTIGFVAKLTPSNPDVDLLHPIFVVIEFNDSVSTPSYKM